MSKHFINDKVEVWQLGEREQGTIYSVRKTLFGKIKYTVAIRQFAGFDPDGIGQEKYKYYQFDEDEILTTLPNTSDKEDEVNEMLLDIIVPDWREDEYVTKDDLLHINRHLIKPAKTSISRLIREAQIGGLKNFRKRIAHIPDIKQAVDEEIAELSDTTKPKEEE